MLRLCHWDAHFDLGDYRIGMKDCVGDLANGVYYSHQKNDFDWKFRQISFEEYSFRWRMLRLLDVKERLIESFDMKGVKVEGGTKLQLAQILKLMLRIRVDCRISRAE